MEKAAFVAPHDYSTFSFRKVGEAYTPSADLMVPPVTRWIRHERFIIFVSRADPAVHLLELDSGKLRSLALPSRARPFDLAVWRDWIFIAAGGKALLATQRWEPGTAWISLPCDKEIDALAIHDEKLLAVDNIIIPKWLLSYELTPSGATEPSRMELPIHSTYEEIEAATYCDGRFAVVSRSVNFGTVGKHVWLLNCSPFEETGHAYCLEASFDPRRDIGFMPLIDAMDIAACRDVLVLAGDRQGLIATTVSSEPRPLSPDLSRNYRGLLCNDFCQFWPSQSRRRPIVRVQTCAEPVGFIMTSLEDELGRDVKPWEAAVMRQRTRAFSYFLSYEEMKELLEEMPPGTMEGTPWEDKSKRAQLRREAGRQGKPG
jgi:hypothetical protein